MEYKVNLPFFEGPLDLLLHLIKKNELDIYDIPIAFITSEYLKHLEVIKVLNLDSVGEFLVMAATLMYIKSKMLLPRPGSEDEKEDGVDPREELVARLLEYQQFKEAARELSQKEFYQSFIFKREGEAESEHLAPLSLELSVFDLINAFSKILERQKSEELLEINVEKFTVNEKISEIIEKLKEVKTMTLDELFKAMTGKIEMIVTFLALLELIRLRMLKVTQNELFGPINIVFCE